MRQLIVEISPAGTVKIDAQGFKGKGCASASEQIEIAIGGPNVTKKKKPDFFCAPVASSAKNTLKGF